MGVGAKAVCFVLIPFAVENVAVSVPENSPALCLVQLPLALVLGPIGPDLNAKAVAHLAEPLTLVHSPILEGVFRPELQISLVSTTSTWQLPGTDHCIIVD